MPKDMAPETETSSALGPRLGVTIEEREGGKEG